MLIFELDGINPSCTRIEEQYFFYNTKENLQAILDFTAWDSIKEINRTFPFLSNIVDISTYQKETLQYFVVNQSSQNYIEKKGRLYNIRGLLFPNYLSWHSSLDRMYSGLAHFTQGIPTDKLAAALCNYPEDLLDDLVYQLYVEVVQVQAAAKKAAMCKLKIMLQKYDEDINECDRRLYTDKLIAKNKSSVSNKRPPLKISKEEFLIKCKKNKDIKNQPSLVSAGLKTERQVISARRRAKAQLEYDKRVASISEWKNVSSTKPKPKLKSKS
jgi:hypothetical protein